MFCLNKKALFEECTILFTCLCITCDFTKAWEQCWLDAVQVTRIGHCELNPDWLVQNLSLG